MGFAHACQNRYARAMPPSVSSPRQERLRTTSRWLLAAAYLFAGAAHMLHPAPFLTITPAWVPFPRQIILTTGLCEVAGAVALLVPRLRWWAGVMLAVYAVCVFPANIKHAVDWFTLGRGGLGAWYHVPRLAFQPVIVWWALFAGAVIDWPFRRRSAA